MEDLKVEEIITFADEAEMERYIFAMEMIRLEGRAGLFDPHGLPANNLRQFYLKGGYIKGNKE